MLGRATFCCCLRRDLSGNKLREFSVDWFLRLARQLDELYAAVVVARAAERAAGSTAGAGWWPATS